MNSMSISDDLEALPTRAIALTTEQLEQARQRSCNMTNPTEQWEVYLNTIALLGFEQWLSQRATDLTIDASHYLMSHFSETLPFVSNVGVNDFKVCLIPVESQPDEIDLPSTALSPELAAHFYVTVAIYEEYSQIAIHSFLRYDQLATYVKSLQPNTDHSYTIPITQFESDLDRFLLYLRCSKPSAISLPLQSRTANIQQRIASSIKIHHWLQNELDELAQQLSWVLLPPPALKNAMRLTAKVVNQPTPDESFEGVIKQLVRNGMTLPSDARIAYQDLDIGRVPARLYAIAGTLPSTEYPPEWTLLLILGPRSQAPLPHNTQLQISDANTVLTQQTLAQHDHYLYAKIIGTLEENFWGTIVVPNHETIKLPAFGY